MIKRKRQKTVSKNKKALLREEKNKYKKTIKRLEELDELTGNVKASEEAVKIITDGVIISDKKKYKQIIKSLNSKPLFKVFESWLLSVDKDILFNKELLIKKMNIYMDTYTDIYTP